MLSEEEVRNKLKSIEDPELGFNIVDLGFIRKIDIHKDSIHVKVVFTTPLCPMAAYLFNAIEESLKDLGFKDIEVEYDWDNPWDPSQVKGDIRKKLFGD